MIAVENKIELRSKFKMEKKFNQISIYNLLLYKIKQKVFFDLLKN